MLSDSARVKLALATIVFASIAIVADLVIVFRGVTEGADLLLTWLSLMCMCLVLVVAVGNWRRLR